MNKRSNTQSPEFDKTKSHSRKTSTNGNQDIQEQCPNGRFYRVISKQFNEFLGQGSYKQVYKGYDTESGREIAWSAISLRSISTEERSKIIEEVKLCKRLKHKNLLHFITAWGNSDTDELVMITEITGGSLKQYLRRVGMPKLKVIKNWAREILAGLDYLHSQNPPVMHRDLKLDNIFVMPHSGDIRIGDFGLSTVLCASLNKTFLGTPEYMAPEIFDNCYEKAIDIYSFGMCMVEMCTLKAPYYELDNIGSVCKAIIERIPPNSYHMIQDLEVKQFISLCLKDKEDRPTAQQLLNHPFLVIDDSDPRNHQPVDCKEVVENVQNEQFLGDKGQIKIDIKILQDNLKQISFSIKMNPAKDSPENVAEEIIRQFGLDHGAKQMIANQLKNKVEAIIQVNNHFSDDSIYSVNQSLLYDQNQDKDIRKIQSEWDLQQLLQPCSSFYITRKHFTEHKQEISQIQAALQKIYGVKLSPNGFYGKKTQTCVRMFQQHNGLTPNGIISKEIYELIISNFKTEKAQETDNDATIEDDQ